MVTSSVNQLTLGTPDLGARTIGVFPLLSASSAPAAHAGEPSGLRLHSNRN
jgi:hypothetical protein